MPFGWFASESLGGRRDDSEIESGRSRGSGRRLHADGFEFGAEKSSFGAPLDSVIAKQANK